jgi:hypothetical protein
MAKKERTKEVVEEMCHEGKMMHVLTIWVFHSMCMEQVGPGEGEWPGMLGMSECPPWSWFIAVRC